MKDFLSQRFGVSDFAPFSLLHTRAYFDTPDPAAPRNLTNEMLQTLAGQQQTAAPHFALEQQYQPRYAGLGLDVQRQNLYGFDDASGHHPGTLELGRASTQYQRAGDIADIASMGPAAQAAFLAANPGLARSLTNLEGRMTDSPILQTLNQQAMTGLQNGGQLSPQEIRALEQQSRAGFADRGNLMGNQSLGAELLSRDAAVRARQQQAQQFATGVQGLNQNQNDFVGRGAQIFGSALSDPFMAVLGRSSGAGGGGPAQQIGTGAQLFDPNNPYAADIYRSNFNAETANNTAQANANNATTSAIISGITALLSDKRLKKDVKSTGAKTRDGIPIKTWRYKTDPKKRKFVGVVAQDVARVRPDAVIEDPFSKIKAVDYSRIDAPFAEVRKILKAA
jgi:hypothetical protein